MAVAILCNGNGEPERNVAQSFDNGANQALDARQISGAKVKRRNTATLASGPTTRRPALLRWLKNWSLATRS
jgi:hypothetical protein